MQPPLALGEGPLQRQFVVVKDLPDHHPVGIAVSQGAQRLGERKGARLRLLMQMPLEQIGPRGGLGAADRRVIRQGGVVGQVVDHIEPKPIDAALQPESRDRQDRRAHLRLMEIEVGLTR